MPWVVVRCSGAPESSRRQFSLPLGGCSVVDYASATFPFIPKPCVGFRRIDRSFALVKIYGMDREERSLVFLPALETQPREDIRRCRGDE
ncbi:BZ3500_MvSof-1268-A1-R1_Chr9g10620 [Microbotryum saponariae]|uniref:BZ3500_MvSof-1268-A1-R1_Chr9g10620 protein n=1 Tax=Microbotryum saponariae TaxID=289078 RepID=A0A2X0MEY7_9BASI|nr:BZ3501_MvSof-1269-A2-R1_Chr9g10368 [Microbotryum saponariae]SDA00400.1 BZ3500_MvSof-1268-A1-R1_Chr9g10620 [Microbotryum saponariae]